MMETQQNRGFILSMVLITLMITGLIMSFLTQNTRTLIIATNRQQIQAINRNLILSARAWARQQHESQDVSMVLDANDLSSRPVELRIDWLGPNHILVKAQATWSTLKIKQQQQFELNKKGRSSGGIGLGSAL